MIAEAVWIRFELTVDFGGCGFKVGEIVSMAPVAFHGSGDEKVFDS